MKTIRLLRLSDIFAPLMAKMDYLKANISMHFELRKIAAYLGYENLTKPYIQKRKGDSLRWWKLARLCPARKGADVHRVLRCEKAGRTDFRRESK